MEEIGIEPQFSSLCVIRCLAQLGFSAAAAAAAAEAAAAGYPHLKMNEFHECHPQFETNSTKRFATYMSST
jgi:hypothetical protein